MLRQPRRVGHPLAPSPLVLSTLLMISLVEPLGRRPQLGVPLLAAACDAEVMVSVFIRRSVGVEAIDRSRRRETKKVN